MKILFTLLFLLAAAPLYAQGGSNKICGIYFDHDAVGNRVKRSYDCRSMQQGPEDPPALTSTSGGFQPRLAPPHTPAPKNAGADGSVDGAPVLFPNPTSGLFTLQLPAPPETPLHFHWYNASLQILGSGTISAAAYKGDISAWPDGVYILHVYQAQNMHRFKVVKTTGGGQ